MYRYDTVLAGIKEVYYDGPFYLETALRASLTKLSGIDQQIPGGFASRKKLSWEDISRFNTRDFRSAIFMDTVLQKGVYMTYDEFKNNHPSKSEFTVQNDKLTDVLYIRGPDGKEYVAREIWGYCDGHTIFIRSADNFFRVQQFNHAFYVYGVKSLDQRHHPFFGEEAGKGIPPVAGSGVSAVLSQINSSRFKLKPRPYQVDWETGKLYQTAAAGIHRSSLFYGFWVYCRNC